MVKNFTYGCPICGVHPTGDNHHCSPEDIAKHEAELRRLDAEPPRTFAVRLEEGVQLLALSDDDDGK